MNYVRTTLCLILVLLGSNDLQDAAAEPLKVCIVSGSAEYRSDLSLPPFKEYLEKWYGARCVLLQAEGFDKLPGLEALDDCDVALFFTRRLTIGGEPLERVKKYCLSGKPIVAVRTASHGFQNFLEFDKEIMGGNYNNHFGNGPTQNAGIAPGAEDHPVLNGVPALKSRYSLYKTAPLAEDCTLLMTSQIPGQEPQPAAWTRVYKGARVFYTSLGGVEDFENAAFRRLIANALFWTAGREAVKQDAPIPPRREAPQGVLKLHLRSRAQLFKGVEDWTEVHVEEEFPIAKTAILVCDMWDKHWCDGATQRCEVLAPKMNEVLKAAREKGIQIVHAPSETMPFYEDYPQRLRMKLAPPVPMPPLLDLPSYPLPIDDSDGGCDTGQEPWYCAWTRQTSAIEIGEFDGISDDGDEFYNFIQQEGIETIIYMGVHTNMCVLGRSFAIRQLTRLGKRCLLARDLTDAMYDPNDAPNVSHEQGTELVVQHIEKYWCPSITSDDLLAGAPK
ncbi:MAG: ThuA domain-containing protein [Candidatus Omnitrophota bacterium]